MKIGIMGGTFNPIHNGHVALACRALSAYDLDEIWFLPNGKPPHKRNIGDEENLKHRLEMLLLAMKGHSAFKISFFEADRSEVSYSYATMEHFRVVYPEHSFYFIVGADSLFSLKNWKHPQRLLNVCTILAACRDAYDNSKVEMEIDVIRQAMGGDIRLLKMPPIPVSSRDIRQAIEEGHLEEIKTFLPESVYQYIVEKGLYQKRKCD